MNKPDLTRDLLDPVLDILGALVVILDEKGRVLRFNEACQATTGYRLSEVTDVPVWDRLVPPEESAEVRAVFQELSQAPCGNRHTNYWVSKGGQRRLIAWSNRSVFSEGRLSYVIGTGIDLTAQKMAESALREREATLSAILETAVDAIVTIDQDGLIEMANPSVARMFGYDTDELIGRNVKLLMPSPFREQHDGYIKRYLETGEGQIIGVGRELQGQRKDGTVFPIHLTVSEFEVHGRRQFASVVHDLSQRKQTERMTTRLGRIVENALHEVYVFDSETLRFLQLNHGARENLGYGHEELLKLTPLDLKPEYTRPDFERHLAPLRRGDRDQVEFETRHRRRDGTTYDVRVRLQLSRAETPPVFIAIVEDISQEKVQREQLRIAQRMEAVGQLTGGIAHDFNNLLTVIIGNLEMLEAGIEKPAQRVMVEQAAEAAQLGADLTARLLAFARRQRLDPKVIDLNDLVLDLTELLRRTLGEAIRIDTVLGKDLCKVNTDPGQLENVLLNLAINARDAMPQGGNLTVETENVAVGAAASDKSAAGLEPGRYVRLSVTDTGEGMTPDVQARAFEPFFTTKQAGAGTGLGLSMVYGFAKQSGGLAMIRSVLGQGTAVELYLPEAAEQAAPDQRLGRDGAELRHGHESVLLVEDDPRVRAVTLQRLETLGYRVVAAADGAEALAALKGGARFDLLFTDLLMPGGINGGELAKMAREIDPEIRILFTSGYADPDAQAATRGLGEVHFLRKPYDRATLARSLRAALGD